MRQCSLHTHHIDFTFHAKCCASWRACNSIDLLNPSLIASCSVGSCIKRSVMNTREHLLQAAVQLVRVHAEASEAPWEALRCLVGDVTYGGRMVDKRDQRVLATYLGRLFCAAAAAPGAALAPAPGYSMPDAATTDAVKVRRRQVNSGIPHAPEAGTTLHVLLPVLQKSQKRHFTWH